MPCVSDPVLHPLATVQNLFDCRDKDINLSQWIDDLTKKMQQTYAEKLNDPGFISQLPYNIPTTEAKLVYVRGMIQDMSRPEFFPIHYTLSHVSKPGNTISKTAIYTDEITCPEEYEYQNDSSVSHDLSERYSMVLVPIPGETDWMKTGSDSSTFCIKIYGSLGEQMKLNDVIHAIAIVNSDKSGDEKTAHVLGLAAKNGRNHLFENEKLGADMLTVRNDVLTQFVELMGGDRVVAEYLLYHTISSIYSRQDGHPLGSLPLNITNIPDSTSKEIVGNIRKCLSALLPKVVYLPLTVDNLNNGLLVPYKDYVNDKLMTASLQLADGTVLIIDETVMNTGILNERGLRNLEAIRGIVQQQQLAYNFQYGGCQVNTDIRLLVLSNAPSLLKVEYTVPLKTTPPQVLGELAGERLKSMRQYLALAADVEYTLDESMQQYVQDQFVDMRKEDNKITAESLHQILTVARLAAMSMGSGLLTEEIWKNCNDMHMEARERMKK